MEKLLTEILVHNGIWGIVIYQLLDITEVVVILLLIGFGIKKAWQTIEKETKK